MPKGYDFNQKVKLDDYFVLPNDGLRSYLGKVRDGTPDEYRTNFGGQKTPVSKILQDWEPIINSITDRWPTLVEFENDLRAKVGPMSIQKPLEERMDDIESYYEGILLPSAPIKNSAVEAVLKEWHNVRIVHRSMDKTVQRMKKSTNAGSPYFTKKRLVVDKTVPCRVGHDGRFVWQELPHGTWEACAVIGWRGQEGGPDVDDTKQRVVWMFPFSVNIRELQVYQPLIESAQRFNLVPAWVSMEAVDARITRMFDTKGPDDLVVCTDFSKFDQHFNPDLQECAKTMFEHILKSDPDSHSWIQDVFPIKYMIPLMYKPGIVSLGWHGMGSGSGGTNADETLVHRALQYEAAIEHNSRLNLNSQCLGDDGVLTYPGITAEDVMQTYTQHGLEMNASKQYVSTQDCTYLRRWHHKDYRVNGVCVGVYSTYRALGRLCEQERYYDPEVWSKEMVALRQLSILENVKWHPLREEFAEFCMKRDKYRLGIDIPGFLANIDTEAHKAIDFMPDFLGYTRSLGKRDVASGISSWWIVNYLKSK